MKAPGQEVITIADGPTEVELLPAVGARIHRIRAFGHDLLRTPDDPISYIQEPHVWGCYVMAPWCNRIAALPTPVGDRVVRLPPNDPDGSALHGQVVASRWEQGPGDRLVVRGGEDAWPWPYEVSEHVTVSGPSLRIDLALTNRADDPMPAGIGLHPWFRGPLEVAVDAPRVIASNTDSTAAIEPVAGRFDLRAMGPPRSSFDATWLDVADPAVHLRWPEVGLEATMRVASAGGVCVTVAGPIAGGAIAVEPATHAPWGLRRFLGGEPYGLRALVPGASLDLRIELEVRRSA